MRSARAASWVIAVVDVVIAYAYALLANAVPFEQSGPHAPWTYWMTQPWVYLLISPLAAVAAWRGLRQFERVRRHEGPWWRLTAEAASAGAVAVILVALFGGVQLVLAIPEFAAVAAGLGLLITAANIVLNRLFGFDRSTPKFLES